MSAEGNQPILQGMEIEGGKISLLLLSKGVYAVTLSEMLAGRRYEYYTDVAFEHPEMSENLNLFSSPEAFFNTIQLSGLDFNAVRELLNIDPYSEE